MTSRISSHGRAVVLGLAVSAAWHAPAHGALLQDDGDFVVLVNELNGLAFTSGSNLYVTPTASDRAAFQTLAGGVWAASTPAQIQALVAPADALGYDVVEFQDGAATYLGLREQLVNDEQTKGWGSFFVRQGSFRDAMVQVPHPLFDTNTPEVGAKAYEQSEARGFLMAGAHRNANGPGTADVADPIGSIFHEVHIAWNGENGETIAWQIHGFDLDGKPQFPADTDAVLSNGTGGVSPEIVALDAAIEDLGPAWVSYAYNTLDVNDPLNVQVNGNVDGEDFGGPNGLGGTTNVQRQYSTSIGGTFVHIELEQSFRLNGAANRQLAADAIAAAIMETAPLIVTPEPAGIVIVAISVILPMFRRRR